MKRSALLVLAFVAAHICAIVVAGRHAMAASYVMLAMAPLLACGAALLRCRQVGFQPTRGWSMVAAACFIWSVGMLASARQDLFLDNASHSPFDSMLLYELYAVPLAWVIATPWEVREARLIQYIDAVLASALSALFYLHIQSVSQNAALQDLEKSRQIAWFFDGENLFLLLCAVIRRWGAESEPELQFFKTLVTYLEIYLFVAAFNNHWVAIELNLDIGSLTDIVLTVPFLVFAAIMSARKPTSRHAVSAVRWRYVRSASPLSMCAALLGLSLVLVRTQYANGVIGVLVAVVGFGLRSVFREVGHIAEHAQLQGDRSALEVLAATDALTGAKNRRAFDEALAFEVRRAARTTGSLGLLLIDIDHFKRLNDTLGHPVGDDCLRRVAQAMAAALRRPSDFLARYGGEEFVVLLPDTGMAGSAAVAETLRQAVEALGLANPKTAAAVVTISVGAAVWAPSDGPEGRPLLQRADSAVYEAKRTGRNRVTCAALATTYPPVSDDRRQAPAIRPAAAEPSGY